MKSKDLPITLQPLTEPYVQIAIQLYESSFPYAERRPTQQWLLNHSSIPLFKIDVITLAGTFQGFITYWLMQGFIYVEHFATLLQSRGMGIGGTAIELFKQKAHLPIVLEVEPATDDLSNRRIRFYSRHGFHLLSQPYMQPSYHEDGHPIPLQIMSTDKDDTSKNFANIVQSIYKHVYNVN